MVIMVHLTFYKYFMNEIETLIPAIRTIIE